VSGDDVVAHHLRVPRTARYHVLGDPAGAEEVWFVIHGYGQLAGRFIERFRALPGAGKRRAVVAPEALSRFYVEREVGPHGRESRVGASWMTREEREGEIRDYVEYLDLVAAEVLGEAAARHPAASASSDEGPAPRLIILGFSQGAETASRWAVLGETRPSTLILWGGGLAADLDPARTTAALAGVMIRFVVGDDDPWGLHKAADALARLRDSGIAAERIDYPGGHRIETSVLQEYWGS